MKVLKLLLPMLIVAILIGCSTQQTSKVELFNGTDLTGWKFLLVTDSVDVKDVWSVKDGVVHCGGVPNGFMMTEKSYSNYKLHVEWRWVGEAGNSGVLLHCQGDTQVWPNTFECQLKSGNAGDFVIIGPGEMVVDGETMTNNELFLVKAKKQDGVEKPLGEWNSYDIVTKNGAVKCSVNGVLQNEATSTSFYEGPIALQSEGAPIEFRNIYIEEL